MDDSEIIKKYQAMPDLKQNNPQSLGVVQNGWGSVTPQPTANDMVTLPPMLGGVTIIFLVLFGLMFLSVMPDSKKLDDDLQRVQNMSCDEIAKYLITETNLDNYGFVEMSAKNHYKYDCLHEPKPVPEKYQSAQIGIGSGRNK